MKEEEIRPQKIFDEYLRLAQEDAAHYFSDAPREKAPCPACQGGVKLEENKIVCKRCKRTYPIVDGVPVLLVDQDI